MMQYISIQYSFIDLMSFWAHPRVCMDCTSFASSGDVSLFFTERRLLSVVHERGCLVGWDLGDYRWHGGTEMNVMEMFIFLLNTSTIVASGNFQHLICVHSGVIVVFNYEVWWIKFLLLLILKNVNVNWVFGSFLIFFLPYIMIL